MIVSLALGAGREQRHRHFDEFLDAANVFDGRGREIGPAAGAAGAVGPPLETFVDRLDRGLRAAGRWQMVEFLVAQAIAHTHLERLDAIEDI